MRSTRSFWDPSFSWKVMASSELAISSSGRFRSCSQKNLASLSRAAITFSLPATISLPPSLAFRLATSRNLLASFLERGSRKEKHFWCVFIEVVRHSGGTSRNDLSNVPMSTTGHSVSPAFSASSALVLDEGELGVLGKLVRLRSDRLGAAASVEHDLVALQALLVVGEACDLERLVGVKAMTARRVAGLDAGDLERHDLAVEQQCNRTQWTNPPQRLFWSDVSALIVSQVLTGVIDYEVRLLPPHGLGPRKAEDRLAQNLRDDLRRRAARLLDAGDVIVALLLVADDLERPRATSGRPP